jgi:hypothetical protein
MPGLSGLDLQKELATASRRIPIIFFTDHGNIPMTVRAMKAGASEFLTKPFSGDELLIAIHQALSRDRQALARLEEDPVLRARFESLTPREREVMQLIVRGLLNKQVAGEFGTTEIPASGSRGAKCGAGKSGRSLFSGGNSGLRSQARDKFPLRKLTMKAVSFYKSPIEEPESFIDVTIEELRRVLDLNLLAPKAKKGCTLTYGWRDHTFWRVKAGATATVQSTGARA